MSARAREAVESSSLFGHLSPDQIGAVVESSNLEVYRATDKIIEEGSAVSALYLIVQGSVHVWTHGISKKVDLKTLEAGSYFGEVSLLSGKSATATVEAQSGVEVLAIAREAIIQLMDEDDKVKQALEGVTLARAKDTIGKVLQ